MRHMLKAAVLLVMLGFTLSAVDSCSPNNHQDGYSVYFETMPNLQDNQVRYNGKTVGTVVSSATGGFRVAKLIVALNEGFAQEAGKNLAFFVRYGSLEATKLSSFGQPLDNETPLCGFNSSMELNWFKIKTLIGDRIAAAEKRAGYLSHRFSMESAS